MAINSAEDYGSHWKTNNNLSLHRAWTVESDKCSDGLVFPGKFWFRELKSFCRNTLILLKSLTDSSLPAGQTGPPCWFMGLPTPRSSWIYGLVRFLSKIFSQLALWLGIFKYCISFSQKKIFWKFPFHGKAQIYKFCSNLGKHLFVGRQGYYWIGIMSFLPEPQKTKRLGCKCHQLAGFTNPLYSFISKVHTCHYCVILCWIYTYGLKWNLLRGNVDVNLGISFHFSKEKNEECFSS